MVEPGTSRKEPARQLFISKVENCICFIIYQKRVSEACGISFSCLYCTKEGKTCKGEPSFGTPIKKMPKRNVKTDLDD